MLNAIYTFGCLCYRISVTSRLTSTLSNFCTCQRLSFSKLRDLKKTRSRELVAHTGRRYGIPDWGTILRGGLGVQSSNGK